MEIRDLTIFAAVARTGSVTKAADELGYVQSNVTARIQQLESKLGTTLFHRLPRGMTLTPSGETLLRYAEQILHLCAEAQQAVQDTDTPSGALRIGAMESTAATRLPAILAKYHAAYPEVELSLHTGPTSHLMEAVLNYELEAAMVAGPVDHPLLEPLAVIEEELVLISGANSRHLPPAHGPLTVLAFREGCSYRKRLERYLDHLGIQSRKVIELGTLDGILGCVAAGLGVAMVPKTVVEHSRCALRTCELPDAFGQAPTLLIRRKDAFQSPALSKFVEVVRQGHETMTR
ncbi:LysR family transcriptional regulator [Alicyclobacillus cycloheptanicus]|uniref:DNA-binding transcriptional LysR family regulator n=1 Tax=Alicyclobacillus cycloheptanicus TaxID=1457 RepID=A0ABT9XF69_9BACL|nr:LysR family transcriptional regulator [Alicyclobacillus cycloheptanicus]MDQ0188386.1 DNA-binding transcriptional LysR family regulator [Alicyclobacillus cycloheptanicus]WDM01092.1 LysR family transcriptional regulator [Alicyclobacillus cycloheptanicus]